MQSDGVLERLFRVNRLTSAQRERVYEAALLVAKEYRDEELVAHIQDALTHEVQARQVESLWQATSGTRAEYVPEMQPLDHELDGELGSLHTVITELISGRRVAPKSREMGADLLVALFPNGVAAVTRQPYVDQARDARDIVNKLQGDYAAHVAHFGLDSKVGELVELVGEYNEALRRSVATMDAATQKATQDRAHRYLLEVLARVLGQHFNGDILAHVETRGSVTEVLFEQIDKARALARARRLRKSAKAGEGDGGGGSGGAGEDGVSGGGVEDGASGGTSGVS